MDEKDDEKNGKIMDFFQRLITVIPLKKIKMELLPVYNEEFQEWLEGVLADKKIEDLDEEERYYLILLILVNGILRYMGEHSKEIKERRKLH